MKIKDIISLKKDIVFGGAVQTEWFYENKAKVIAENFVFHGPEFFGVTDDDVEFKTHKLMDTCTYTNMISNRLSSDEGNPIILTIAGYGTGKSHLSVTLGSLFSVESNNPIFKKILTNIKSLNRDIGKEIEAKYEKPNLVLVLNGMKDFNLNYEILNSIKKTLKQKGYNDEIFSEFTKAHNIAYKFLDKNFNLLEENFIKVCQQNEIKESNLEMYLKDNIYLDNVFDSINEVYKEFTGEYIRWDDGVSAAEVLKKLSVKFCGEKGAFNKILILFDEFGRYIEYASEYPNRAGDSTLQQLFEAIQDSDNKIIFNAFIQSDLKTYLSRVNKSSNISRYIGRYEAGEKIYLSSNLETIFANLINKIDKEKFNEYIKGYFEKVSVDEKQKCLFDNLNKWISNTNNRGIWKDYDKYKRVILEGIYPLDPIATWMITDLSDWYQQRSALNFLMKSFDEIENAEIHQYGEIPTIKAIDIIKGDLFAELLLAEEEGRQKSEYCTVYDRVKIKYSDKLNDDELDILAGILILKICKFRTKNKEDLMCALESITGLVSKVLIDGLLVLEENYGVIAYDERNFTYDFVEDATGKNDFLRLLRRKKNSMKFDISNLIGNEILDSLGISNVIEPKFAKVNFIKSSEWKYEASIIYIDDINELTINNMIKDFNESTSPDIMKGKIIYVYIDGDAGIEGIENLKKLYAFKNLAKYPFVFSVLDDKKNIIKECLEVEKICKSFNPEEKIKYSKYIEQLLLSNMKLLADTSKDLRSERLFLDIVGIEKKENRLVNICDQKLEEIYPNIVSFDFVGFENKKIAIAKKIYVQISKLIIQDSLNYQTISTLGQDSINRIKAVLENERSGWGVLSIKSNIVKLGTPKNLKVKRIFDYLDNIFYETEKLKFSEIIQNLIRAPYGLNDFSALLILLVYTVTKKFEAKISLNKKIINNIEWSKQVFTEKNTIIYSVINNTELIKIDIDGYKLKYQKICADIELNTDIDVCESLRNELDELIREAEVPVEFIEKVEGCQIILNEGIKLKRKVCEKIGNAEAILENSIEKEEFKSLIELAISVENESVDSDSDRFIYSDVYINRFKIVGDKSRTFIEKNFEKYIKGSKSSCRSLEQVTKYESWINAMANGLRKLGYSTLSRLAVDKKNKEIDNLQFMREVKNVENELEHFLGKQINVYLTQEELIFLEKEGKRLSKNLSENNKLKEIDKVRLNNSLIKKQELVGVALKEISDKLNEIYDLSYELNSLAELKQLKSKITYVLGKKLREEDKQDIEEMMDEIQNFLNRFEEINLEQSLILRIEKFERLDKIYQDIEVITLNNVIQNIIESCKEEIKQKNKSWKEKNLNLKAEKVKEFTANECYGWMKKTDTLPEYLDKKNINAYEKLKILIEEQLKFLKIESVIELFENLSEDEKDRCLTILNTKI